MARKGFSLDFDGFLDFAREVDELGEGLLQKAVKNALTETKNYVNGEILKAMDASKYHFDGTGYSQLRSKKGLEKVEQMDVEINGPYAVAYAGVSYYDARELWFIANGAPNTPKDQKLYNAVRVKGNIAKQVKEIQKEEFNKVIEEALNG